MEEKLKTDQILSKLKGIIVENKGHLTPKEAITSSGYTKDEVMRGLDRLIELFEARVNLNANTGELQFIFKYPLFERDKKTFTEKFASFINSLYKIFKQIYKVSIGIVLIAYTLIFALLIIIISLGSSSSNNNDDNRSSAGFDIVILMFRAISEGMFWSRYSHAVEYASDPYGNKYKTYKQKSKKTSFIHSVFSFVFGPEQPKFDMLADAREVAAYIRLKTKGKLTSANIIELSGVNYRKAESKLAEYVGKFQGNLEISNEGVLYGDFYDMLGNANQKEEQYIEYYKDEVEPPVELTGNSTGRNIAIAIMNGFNLLMSYAILNGNLPIEIGEVAISEYAFLTYFPLTVSVLYFLIPLIRTPSVYLRKKKRSSRILHKKIVGYICQQRKQEFTLQEFLYYLKIENQNEADIIKSILEKISIELDGTMEITQNGELIYKFERLYNELSLK